MKLRKIIEKNQIVTDKKALALEIVNLMQKFIKQAIEDTKTEKDNFNNAYRKSIRINAYEDLLKECV